MRVPAVVLTLLLVCLASSTAFAAQRVVLCEDFTNFNCPPCDAIQDTMDAIFGNYVTLGLAAPFRYHVWWPDASDPMYNFNVSDVQAKVSYYGVGYVPTFRYDGTTRIDPSDYGTYPDYYAAVRSNIEALAAISAPIRFNFSQQRILNQVYVSFDVIVEAGATGLGTSQSLYLAVVEENQNYPAGKEWYVFRDFVPDGAAGYALALVAGDSLHFDWSYSTSLAVQPNKLVTYLFVQKESTISSQRKVLNALRQKVANPTDVVSEITPLAFKLDQNRPNPFNPLTAIPFHVDRAGDVRLTIFDAGGRRVATLVDGHRDVGTYSETWDGRNVDGKPVSSGVYYYRLESVNASDTRKMTLVR